MVEKIIIMDTSRRLPISEFLRVLQLEYLSYVLRSLIYTEPIFVKMNEEIAKKKRDKIKNLSEKFKLLSIFDSEELFRFFLEKEFLQEFGLPKFQYGTDPKKKLSVFYYDKYYVLKESSKVDYRGQIYLVKRNNPETETISLNIGGSITEVPYTYVNFVELSSLLQSKIKI